MPSGRSPRCRRPGDRTRLEHLAGRRGDLAGRRGGYGRTPPLPEVLARGRVLRGRPGDDRPRPVADEIISFAALQIAERAPAAGRRPLRLVRPRRMPEARRRSGSTAEEQRPHRRAAPVRGPRRIARGARRKVLVAHVAAVERGFLAAALQSRACARQPGRRHRRARRGALAPSGPAAVGPVGALAAGAGAGPARPPPAPSGRRRVDHGAGVPRPRHPPGRARTADGRIACRLSAARRRLVAAAEPPYEALIAARKEPSAAVRRSRPKCSVA